MRVLVVDDHPAIRLGVKSLLEMTGDKRLIGEAKGSTEAVRMTKEMKPDLVILDLELGGDAKGLAACRTIKALPDPPRVLVHTAHDDTEHLASAALAGADGYLHKGAEHVSLLEAVERVARGERVWAISTESGGSDPSLATLAGCNDELTSKEREVFMLMRKRYANAEIARELFISLNTTKHHVTSILRKLGLKSRRELF